MAILHQWFQIFLDGIPEEREKHLGEVETPEIMQHMEQLFKQLPSKEALLASEPLPEIYKEIIACEGANVMQESQVNNGLHVEGATGDDSQIAGHLNAVHETESMTFAPHHSVRTANDIDVTTNVAMTGKLREAPS